MKLSESKYFELCSNLKKYSFKQIKEKWKSIFYYICETRWHYPKTVVQDLWNWGYSGNNWDVLHIENTKYKDYNVEQLIEEFCGDVSYCCDRFSLDRLLRAHWLYQQILIKKKKD